mmetsp:Transcript_36430/g.88981  ORF Transcript_36430/g.88981 Transcript_36430/m.88981 type:complete len:241 (+) Transcript_36430:424-1146(+)
MAEAAVMGVRRLSARMLSTAQVQTKRAARAALPNSVNSTCRKCVGSPTIGNFCSSKPATRAGGRLGRSGEAVRRDPKEEADMGELVGAGESLATGRPRRPTPSRDEALSRSSSRDISALNCWLSLRLGMSGRGLRATVRTSTSSPLNKRLTPLKRSLPTRDTMAPRMAEAVAWAGVCLMLPMREDKARLLVTIGPKAETRESTIDFVASLVRRISGSKRSVAPTIKRQPETVMSRSSGDL